MPITDQQSVADKIHELAGVVPGLAQLEGGIAGVITSHTDDWTVAITLEERTALLRALTGFVAALDVHVACFPMGYTDTLLFDEDGNPI